MPARAAWCIYTIIIDSENVLTHSQIYKEYSLPYHHIDHSPQRDLIRMNKDDSIDIARRPSTPDEVPVEKYAEKDMAYPGDDGVVVLDTVGEDNADIATKA